MTDGFTMGTTTTAPSETSVAMTENTQEDTEAVDVEDSNVE